jgi:hypothetical protein
MLYDEVYQFLQDSTTSDTTFFSLASMFTCSIAVGNNVKLKTKFGTVKPNLYVMLIGKSTISHKSTIESLVIDMLADQFSDSMITGTFSPEGLVSALEANRTAVMVKDEFGGLLEGMSKKDYMSDSKDLLMELFDNKKMITRTLSKQKIVVRDPYFAMMTAVTMERFKETFTYSDIYNGFLVRFLIGLYQKSTDEHSVNLTAHSLRKIKIMADIAEIRNVLNGNNYTFVLSEESEQFFNDYMKNNVNENMDEFTLALRGRLNIVILKVALILFVLDNFRSLKTVSELDVEYIKRGIQYVEPFYNNAKTLFKDITMHPQVLKIKDIIKEKGIADHSFVLWRSHMKSSDLRPIIQTLIEMGSVVQIKKKGKTVYIYRKTELDNL